MRSSKLAMAAAASMMTVMPTMVQAAPVERAAAPSIDGSELSRSYIWIFVVLAAIVAAVLLLKNDNDPVSP